MENTLGKRVAAGRRKLGLTQDQLAEKLGVTAQAVSKWENDQSCPDITMLPKLAEIFGTSTDVLLGMAEETVKEAEVVSAAPEEKQGFDYENGTMEFHYDSGRRPYVGFAVWVLLVGVLALTNYFRLGFGYVWDVAWPSAMLVFGLMGLYPKFSLLRLVIGFFGGYFLLEPNYNLLALNTRILVPILLVLLGIELLIKALRKPSKPSFSVNHAGNHDFDKQKSSFTCGGEHFSCSTSFGERHHRIDLDRLSGGRASVSFGELDVDLTAVRAFAPGCQLDLSCSFGELELLVPRTCKVIPNANSSFASVEFKGAPREDAADEISLNCDVSFGSICIKFI